MDRRSLLFGPLIALHASRTTTAAEPSSIAGRWRSQTTTRGGIGAIYEFQSNGSATYSSVVLVETEYQQLPDGAHLVLDSSSNGPEPQQAIGMGWLPGGRLQLNYGKDDLENYTRQGDVLDPANPLIGEWKGNRTGPHGQRMPVTYRFLPGKAGLVILYLRTHSGRYSHMPAGDWTMTIPTLATRTMKLDPATGSLAIREGAGNPYQFSRLETPRLKQPPAHG